MSIIQFLFHLLSKFGLPMSQTEYETSVAGLSAQWDEIPADDSLFGKAKKVLENPLAKMALAALAIYLGKLIKDWLDRVEDKDGDGDADLMDMIAAALEKRKQQKELGLRG